MRTSVAVLLMVPLLLVGCSSSPDSSGPGLGGDPFEEQGGDNLVPEDNGAGVPAGEVDCDAISQQSLLTFGYGVQALAQLDNQAAVDSVEEGPLAFDPDAFGESLVEMRALDGHSVDPYGDPAEALDYYEAVNDAARNLLAYDTPVPTAEFTEYSEVTGGSAEVIAQQSSISASYNANCAA